VSHSGPACVAEAQGCNWTICSRFAAYYDDALIGAIACRLELQKDFTAKVQALAMLHASRMLVPGDWLPDLLVLDLLLMCCRCTS
jgi:uncharacterized membrane protein